MEELEQLGIIPVDYAVLRSLFADYHSPRNKIASIEQAGKIVRLKRGMYVVSPEVTKQLLSVELIANHIYGPSYVSMESALRYYGLIPEQVYTVRSLTTKRSKFFENSIANFEYIITNDAYYAIGIKQETIENRYTFLIATPEKALCDMITATPHLRIQSKKALATYLKEDLRFDMSGLDNMDSNILKECLKVGKKKEALQFLLDFLES